MYLLKFLSSSSDASLDASSDRIAVEYRLACSGELYNRNVQTYDWRKSDVTRVLLRTPLELFVASQPFAAYPQELCVRLALAEVTESQEEQGGCFSRTFIPDEDIIEDLCSILSLLSRRLISPGEKVREQYPQAQSAALGSYGTDVPTPVLSSRRLTTWAQRPATVVTSFKGLQFIDNSPPPVGVNPKTLAEVLLKLPTIPEAAEIVHASRLYRAAFELIESRPDISYQLLISTVESLAAVALEEYQPEESEQLAAALPVQKRALAYGLDSEKAKRLALDACKGHRWLKKKFKKFLLEFAPKDKLVGQDRVFLVPENLCPPFEDRQSVFGLIYDMRSGNLHTALPFPRSIAIGTAPSIKWRDLPLNLLMRSDIPPVAWFERVVSIAAREYILGRTAVEVPPFVDFSPPERTELPGASIT